MKFIPGTKFINKTTSNTKLFKKGLTYILNDIETQSDGTILYTFLVNRSIVPVNFKSIKEAEDWLEKIVI